ncbi:acyltransferase family protein [Arthrobacter sp. H14-L1]|uniref:acyltransferase family protein n=1 Tax=Arthrobacter sp. H14-L1 TaxID=2996697 RepID=UPI00226DE4E9|nr:acyltransferase family protein [Arthrobacter sp. H14-L1]MCY0904397.1 acyltransferase family protein [Arthrobacter sp. H14-L1]
MTSSILAKPAGRRSTAGRRGDWGPRNRKFLPEVQGLRSLAVLMVVVYHVWLGRVSGGVDIFLLVSAFLMTRQFVGKVERGAPLDLLKHWLHLFKRLLPAVVVVLLAVLAATYLWLPQTRWKEIFSEIWASMLYFENWALASNSVDYYAADHSVASPLQHFWSLSIQGQVFILWPLIFAAAALLAKVFRLRYRVLLTYVFGLVFLASLVFSIQETGSNQAVAYFDTRTRLWEFALGSLLALALPYLNFPRILRVLLGWIGIVAMISCGIVLEVDQQFPGYIALWPTVAAALIIIAGKTESPIGADRLLSSRPLVFMGGNSYALYLWHWPLLVIYLGVSGQEKAGWFSGTVVIVSAIVLSILTTRFVEKPIRDWKWAESSKLRAGVVMAVSLALVAVPLGGLQLHLDKVSMKAGAGSTPENPGAAALFAGYSPAASAKTAPLVPALTDIADQWPVWDGGCTVIDKSDESRTRCDNGNDANPAKTIAVVGSSHALMWSTPLLEMAKKNNWRVVAFTGGFCPVTDGTDADISPGCADYVRGALDSALELRPDAVVTTSTRAAHSLSTSEYLDPSWAGIISKVTAAGIPVVAIRDTPRFDQTPLGSGPDCVAKNLKDYSICATAKDQSFSAVSPTDALQEGLPGVSFLDFTPYFCPEDSCPAVIGNVLVYKDSNHVTRTYLSTLTPVVEQAFIAATGWEEGK